MRDAVWSDDAQLSQQLAGDRGTCDEEAAEVGQFEATGLAVVGDLAPDGRRAEGARDFLGNEGGHQRGGVGRERLGRVEEANGARSWLHRGLCVTVRAQHEWAAQECNALTRRFREPC